MRIEEYARSACEPFTGGAMARSHLAREVLIMLAVIMTSCVSTVGLTIFLTSFTSIQSAETGYAGEAFGAAAAASSVVVLVYIARTFHRQGEEARMQREALEAQRTELSLQRGVAENQHETSRRVAEAAVRGQHRHLLQMAIDDPTLMAVWPGYGPDVSEERQRQFMYANLIISHWCMCYELGYYSEAEIVDSLSHTFSSAKILDFWETARIPRDSSTPHTGGMREFYDLCELAYQHQLMRIGARSDSDSLAEPH
ncbi:DUF6082 family protein [Streptomyces sp. NPDC041068]|uniref:DUF6082 family protein n=1 Tax=Streptomyces sp. NPDC041068 TaxID=3155130 RepID=UPI00340B5ABB